jgi:hypothetical protein
MPRVALASEHPNGVYIEHTIFPRETLELLARQVEQQLVKDHPADSLF